MLVAMGIIISLGLLMFMDQIKRYPASACEMVMWSPSQTGGFPPGTLVSSHTKTIRTQTSVPTSMINISCLTWFVIVVKYIKLFCFLKKIKRWKQKCYWMN